MPPIKKFNLLAGRDGFIEFVDGERSGRLAWEMLVGEFALAIYARGSVWLGQNQCPIQPDELGRLAQEFATESDLSVEVQFVDKTEPIWPNDTARQKAERAFFESLGSEQQNTKCQLATCSRGAIPQSVYCRVHHFQQIRGRFCPFEIEGAVPVGTPHGE